LQEVLTSTCNPEKNRIFWEARRNPKSLDITLEDKWLKEIFNIECLASIMRSLPRQLRRNSINTGHQISFGTYNSQLYKCKSAHCRNWVSAQVWRVVEAAATATCILGLGLDFLLVMVWTFFLVC
jgi:hypothetical protein